MLAIAFVMALQAPPAASQQVALNMEAAAVAASDSPAAATEDAAPARKRVCRTMIDNRTGIIAKQRKVCRFVDESVGRTD